MNNKKVTLFRLTEHYITRKSYSFIWIVNSLWGKKDFPLPYYLDLKKKHSFFKNIYIFLRQKLRVIKCSYSHGNGSFFATALQYIHWQNNFMFCSDNYDQFEKFC
jgi:hypothetical protein